MTIAENSIVCQFFVGLWSLLLRAWEDSRVGSALATLGAIGVAVVIYLVLVVVLRAITREDLSLMPKGERIARLLGL